MRDTPANPLDRLLARGAQQTADSMLAAWFAALRRGESAEGSNRPSEPSTVSECKSTR